MLFWKQNNKNENKIFDDDGKNILFPFLEPSPADAEFSYEFIVETISLKTRIIINSCIRDVGFCSVCEYVCVYMEY
jgi:hypothetical protein